MLIKGFFQDPAPRDWLAKSAEKTSVAYPFALLISAKNIELKSLPRIIEIYEVW